MRSPEQRHRGGDRQLHLVRRYRRRGRARNIVSGGGSGSIPPNNADIRLRQRQSTTVRLPGYGGANNNDAAVVTYLTGRNTLSTAAASNTVPTGGGFIGGACIVP